MVCEYGRYMITQVKSNGIHRDLGFIKAESKEVVEKLNKLLANYQIHYQKLRNFHWNVKGGDFFDIHEQFQIEYTSAQAFMDEIAERIRTFGSTPFSTLKDYLNESEITEADAHLAPDKMVEEIITDFTQLMGFLVEGIEVAQEIGDLGTSDILVKDLRRMEKRHWMFSAFASK